MKTLVPTGRPDPMVEIAESAMPVPQPGEAMVRVEAFSVNRGEIFLLEDPRHGARPGKDIAGLVVQAAADGTCPAAGQRVVGHPEAGGWAEYAAVPVGSLAPIPHAPHQAATPCSRSGRNLCCPLPHPVPFSPCCSHSSRRPFLRRPR
jgi:NADPH:quinone reductase-like Zn-dependent oxidoreductase